jgi:hypothetical protein
VQKKVDPVTTKGPVERFVGDVYVTEIDGADDPSPLVAALVRFTPSSRTNWHSHAFGQTLHVTGGSGASPPGTARSCRFAPATPFTRRLGRNTGTARLSAP